MAVPKKNPIIARELAKKKFALIKIKGSGGLCRSINPNQLEKWISEGWEVVNNPNKK